jgi:hypothetical protein
MDRWFIVQIIVVSVLYITPPNTLLILLFNYNDWLVVHDCIVEDITRGGW